MPISLLWRGMHLFWRFSRGQTLEIEILARNTASAALLIEPQPGAGWRLPCAFVAPGETAMHVAQSTLSRICRDACVQRLALCGLHRAGGRRSDHIALYAIDRISPAQAASLIEGAGFFPTDALPPDTDPWVRRRLTQVVAEAASGSNS
jgi:hypothetical protein